MQRVAPRRRTIVCLRTEVSCSRVPSIPRDARSVIAPIRTLRGNAKERILKPSDRIQTLLSGAMRIVPRDLFVSHSDTLCLARNISEDSREKVSASFVSS